MNDQSKKDSTLQSAQDSPTSLSDEGDGMPTAAAQVAGTSPTGISHSSGTTATTGLTFGTEQPSDAGSSKPSLREEMAQFKSELDVLISHASSLSERELGEAYSKLMTRFQNYRAKAADMASTAQEQLNHGVDVACEHVKEKPMQSMAIAAGAGMLMGLVMRRRRADRYR